MKRRTKYILLCLVPAGALLAVLFAEPDKSFLFANDSGDCNGRSIFMYNALYNNPNQADVLLVGSSKTMNGINDSMLNRLGGQKFLNLGYCRFGRNLDYFFVEQYCHLHHPKALVLEVREHESQGSHPVSPFLLPLDQLAVSAFCMSGDFFPDLYNKWLCNLKFIRKKLFNPGANTEVPPVDARAGFWYGYKPPVPEELKQQRYSDSCTLASEKPSSNEALNAGSEFYLSKIAALCKAKHMRLYLLYLSSYGNLWKTPASYESYLRYGAFLSVPDSILQDVNNFSDFGHFNLQGANKASLWLAGQLNRHKRQASLFNPKIVHKNR